MEREYFVYILASHTGTLYIGVTGDLVRRIFEHQNGLIDGFSKKYQCHRLVHFEETQDVWAALEREKQLKKWNRSKKEWLIKKSNPDWRDLSEIWLAD